MGHLPFGADADAGGGGDLRAPATPDQRSSTFSATRSLARMPGLGRPTAAPVPGTAARSENAAISGRATADPGPRFPAPAGADPSPRNSGINRQFDPSATTAVESPGDAAVASGIAMRQTDGSVVFPTPRSAGTTGTAGTAATAGTAGTVSRAPENGNGTSATVTGATEAADSAGAAGTPDLATMAELLYERIEYRLRHDLLLERERLGALPDF